MATKMNLLAIVQEVLSDMDSDEVNSIDDTMEATQVAYMVRSVYRSFMSNRNWANQRRAIQLVPYSAKSHPTHMRIKDEVKELSFVQYNCVKEGETKRAYRNMTWLDPDDFLRRVNAFNTDNDNVEIITDPSGIEIAILNDQSPTYYTSFDDDTLVFDSYNSDVEDTLMASKTQAFGYIIPEFTLTDKFVPDLPSEAFSALVAEVKSQAFAKLKQEVSQKDEQESVRQQQWLARKNWRVNGGIKYPNYGRRGKGRMSSRQPFDHSSYKNRID